MNEWESFEFELISVRKKWFQLKEDLSRNKLKPDINATEWLLKQICVANKIDEYPIITSITEIAFITRVSNAWPERIGSTIKRIKINKRSALKSGALKALIMISTNDPKCETPEASYLIKQTSILFGEPKNDKKKTSAVQGKETSTQTSVSGTHTEILHAESESQIDIDNCLDAIATSDKYIVSNLTEMSESSGTDSDDDENKIIFDFLYKKKILINRLELL